MTRTTQVEWHHDRPLVHFGSPPEIQYWREEAEKPKKAKEPKTYYPGRGKK